VKNRARRSQKHAASAPRVALAPVDRARKPTPRASGAVTVGHESASPARSGDVTTSPRGAPGGSSSLTASRESARQTGGLRERKKAALKLRIAQVALDLVRERGYDAATVDEIVARVEVSQPTFYKYFTSKDAILREYAVAGFGALLQDELARTGSIVLRMRRYLKAVARQMERDQKLWYAIAVSNAYNPVREPHLLASSEAGTRVLEAAIEEGQRTGEFTRAYSARRLASLLEGVMMRVCIEWGAGFPDQRPLSGNVDEGFDLFLRAAMPHPGDASRHPTPTKTRTVR
jgi:AcrR family transcriptional regulator